MPASGKARSTCTFPNKEELFRAVVRQRLTPNLEAIGAMVAAHTGPTADLLRQIAERALALIETDVIAIPKLVLAESGNFPAIARLHAEEVAARGLALLEGVLARGMERGEFRRLDPHSLVPMFTGPIMVMALWKQSLGPHTDIHFDPRKVIATHLDVFLRGIAESPDVKPAQTGLALLVLGGAAAFAWWRLAPAPATGWQGYVDADYVKVAPTQQGLLTAVDVHRGDTVKAGASLFAQDDT